MALTYVNQIGADGGVMQSAPVTMITEANLAWAQDVLVDRTGYIRRRGPFTEVATGALRTGEMIMGVSTTHDPLGAWRACALVGDDTSSRIVFYNTAGSLLGWSWLPFKHPNGSFLATNTTQQNADVRVQNPITMFKGREALTGGCFLSVFTRYGIPSFNASSAYPRFQSLYFWRGGHGIDCSAASCAIALDGSGVTGQFSQTITTASTLVKAVSTDANDAIVTSGMFVFDDDGSGNPYQCVGVVKSVNGVDSATSPTSIVLEKRPMVAHISGGYDPTNHSSLTALSAKKLHFRNVRGYQHLHGRGLITLTSGTIVTSGVEGSGTDGHFGAAKMNEGVWYVYRNSDHAIIGKVDAAGSMNNQQFTLTVSGTKVILTSDEYVAVPVSTVISTDNNITTSAPALEPSPYYQPRISGSVDDAASGVSNDTSSRTPKDVPGFFTATYAGFQWYGSLGQTGYENQIVFSSYHDPEAVDLSPDAADSIVIPGINIMRGLAASSTGLIIFMADNTYILRGNDRTNFSLEVLYPEGCLSAGSIVEIGGGVIWATSSGILYYDGASIRNITKDALGTYWYDSIKRFDANADRINAFFYKNYLFMTLSKWESPYSFSRFEPLYINLAAGDTEGSTITWEGSSYAPSAYTDFDYSWTDVVNRLATIGYERITNTLPFVTFAVYMPTGSITSFSNFSFVGAANLDAIDVASSTAELNYEKLWVGINASKRLDSSAEFVSGRVPNIVTSVTGPSVGKNTVTFNTNYSNPAYNPDITGYLANGSVVDLVDRNDDTVVSSVVVETLNTGAGTFKYTAATLPSNVVGFVKPEYLTFNKGAFVGVDAALDITSNGYDSFLALSEDVVGPDLYFQTKVYTVGDPVIKKWFQRLMVDMLIKGGSVRVDMIDYENNDFVDSGVDERNWTVFSEVLYSWVEAQINFGSLTNSTFTDASVPPQTGTSWTSLEALASTWDDVLFPKFERRTKRFSLRTNALGYQFYQLNRWKPSTGNRINTIRPKRIETDAWSIGFKALRTGRQ